MDRVFRILNPSGRDLDDSCSIETLPAVTLALAEIQVTQAGIPEALASLFEQVRLWLANAGLAMAADRYALYDRFGADGMRLRAGYPVAHSFAGDEGVQCCELPGLRVAHYRHEDDVSLLPAAHVRLHEWCLPRELKRQPLSLEIYRAPLNGDAPVTDVYVQVG